MSRKKKLIYFIFLLVITSCTIQKRVHLDGYYIKWKKSYKTEKNINTSELEYNNSIEKENVSIINTEFNDYADNSNNIKLEEFKGNNFENNKFKKNDEIQSSKKNNLITRTLVPFSKLVNKNILNKKDLFNKNEVKKNKLKSRVDSDLLINIILTVVFAGLVVLFLILGLAATAPMIYVWYGLALISLIFFITQVIDLIRY